MSAAALAQRLRNGAIPGTGVAVWNGWNGRTAPVSFQSKQADLEAETDFGTDGTGGTGVFVDVEVRRKESRPDQAANDAQASAPAPDWRQADAAYLRHHFTCKTCCAAGHGRGDRCSTGAELWGTYQAAWEADQATNTKGRSAR